MIIKGFVEPRKNTAIARTNASYKLTVSHSHARVVEVESSGKEAQGQGKTGYGKDYWY
jgi:hypothetical protein